MGTGGADGLRLVLVGTSTPLGAEVKRRLAEGPLPVREAVLADFDPLDEEGGRRLSDYAGEAQLVADAAELECGETDLVILCGDPERTAGLLRRAGRAAGCIDASGASRRQEGVAWLHYRLHDEASFPHHGRVGAPQPAAATLATLVRALAGAGPVRDVAATVLLPAAALGEGAVEELYQQTLALLNFTDLPTQRLTRQLAFNLLPWEDASRAGSGGLADGLRWEVARLLGDGAPPCDLQLLLAPTFHGYSFSLRLQASPEASAADLAGALRSAGLQVVTPEAEPPSPVLTGERRGIRVAPPRAAGDGVFWLWVVADSLGDGAAENVVRLARRMAGGAGR